MAWSDAAREAALAARRMHMNRREGVSIGQFQGQVVHRDSLHRLVSSFAPTTRELHKAKLTSLQAARTNSFVRYPASVKEVSRTEMAQRLSKARSSMNKSPGWYAPFGKWDSMRTRNVHAVSVAKYGDRVYGTDRIIYQAPRRK